MSGINGNISRRNFLTAASVAGAGSLLLGLTGCAPQPLTATGDSAGKSTEGTSSSKLIAVTDDMVGSTEEFDIVVAGSGSAGTYAAIRAAELGAKVLWLEKVSTLGGTSAITEGMSMPNSKKQLAEGEPSDTQATFESLMAWHNWSAYAPGLWSYLDNAGRAIDWALEHNTKLRYNGGERYGCADENGKWINMGTGMLEPLRAYGDTLSSLEVRTECPVVNLAYDNGVVAGVYAQPKGDDIIRVNAKKVILATGGYGSNMEMCKERLRVPAERVVFLNFEGCDGDGINMALEAGGAPQAPSAVNFGLSKVMGDSWDGILTIFTQWMPEWRVDPEETLPAGKCLPMVNEHGKRFLNETLVSERDTSRLNCAIASQSRVYTIFNQAHVDTYSGFDVFDYGSGIAEGNFQELLNSSSAVVKADTLEALAQAMDIDSAAFMETMNDYNARAKGNGSHDSFGADAAMLTVLEEGPFYAVRAEACAYGTFGGVRGNYYQQVVNEEGGVVENLYVCSLDNGSMGFNDYPYGLHGGTTQGNACCSGFVAAEHACQEIGLSV